MRAVLESFRPGRTIYLPGATGECLALAQELRLDPERLNGVHLVSCLIPGINSFDYASLHPNARLTCFLLPPELRGSFLAGRVRLLPLTYSEIARYMGERMAPDVAVAHVAEPNGAGQCSLGVCADFTSLVWARARTKILLINHAMPAIARSPHVSVSDANVVVDLGECPLVAAIARSRQLIHHAIAQHVARLIPEGAAIQTGIGAAPDVVWHYLAGHRDLCVASGIVTDSFLAAARAGALKRGGCHITGVAFGTNDLYEAIGMQDLLTFASVRVTHDATTLERRHRFIAVNSALEVDLFGQANLEWRQGRALSGVGGAPDFARAAARSRDGRSIIALPATANAGAVSRIVGKLETPTTSIARSDIDTVVTEFGVAELRNASMHERGDALIEIAAPQFRSDLRLQWDRICRAL